MLKFSFSSMIFSNPFSRKLFYLISSQSFHFIWQKPSTFSNSEWSWKSGAKMRIKMIFSWCSLWHQKCQLSCLPFMLAVQTAGISSQPALPFLVTGSRVSSPIWTRHLRMCPDLEKDLNLQATWMYRHKLTQKYNTMPIYNATFWLIAEVKKHFPTRKFLYFTVELFCLSRMPSVCTKCKETMTFLVFT